MDDERDNYAVELRLADYAHDEQSIWWTLSLLRNHRRISETSGLAPLTPDGLARCTDALSGLLATLGWDTALPAFSEISPDL